MGLGDRHGTLDLKGRQTSMDYDLDRMGCLLVGVGKRIEIRVGIPVTVRINRNAKWSAR